MSTHPYVIRETTRCSGNSAYVQYTVARVVKWDSDGAGIGYAVVGSWVGPEGRTAAHDICRLMNDYAEFES